MGWDQKGNHRPSLAALAGVRTWGFSVLSHRK